ncbi:MAG TPA: HDIG domain-containing metalloprotein [Symbiobacteriaceae bacterium]
MRRLLYAGLFFALLTLILASQLAPQRLEIEVGDVAPRTVEAPRAIVNRVATEAKKQAAAQAIPPLTRVDPSFLRQAEEYITFVFQEIQTVKNLPNQDTATRVETLAERLQLGSAVSTDTYQYLLEADAQSLSSAREDALRLVREALSGSVGPEDVEPIRQRIDAEQEGFTLQTEDPILKDFVKELAKSQIQSNLVEDEELTEQLRKQAYENEEPVIWQKGQIIITKGQPVTEEQYEMLKDLGLVGGPADVRAILGAALLSAVQVALMGLYLYRYRRDLLEEDHKTILLGFIGIITLLLSLMMNAFRDGLGDGVAYLMPVGVNAMLVTILLDAKAALLQSALLSVLVGLLSQGEQLNHALVALVGSTVGVYSVSRVESRTDIYRAGLLISAANVLAIASIYLIGSYSFLDLSVWVDMGLGAANGIVVAILVTGALPVFETLFGVVTPLKLLELSNPNHPLLKRLLVEAPGSYHHTILVANLCEAAAEAVGADPVLARVGAYFHDIGKIKRPYFFVENQFGGENPHDKLPPNLSAMIITSHVRDGLEMAKEARLPKEVADFIPEHHGTTLVSYFYHMASKDGGAERVLEKDFRYEGPRPRRKETAICMLADSCEASVRALRQKGHLTVDQIEAQVKRIIADRLQQGQLDECDLTFRDLEIITRTFVRVLSGVHHARIEYPTGEMQGDQADGSRSEEGESVGNLDQQPAAEGGADAGAGGDRPEGDRGGPEAGGQ